jgi:hypothetical protein
MNLRKISVELSKITAKIDNFTMLGGALLADQRKLLGIAVSTQPNNISEPTKRDENIERTLWNAIDQMCREMTEQKLFFEKQLAESKAEADQMFARQETKLEEVRKDFEDFRMTLTTKITDMDIKMSSFASFAEEKAGREEALSYLEFEKSVIEDALGSQRKEIDQMTEEIRALTSKINKMDDRDSANQLSKLKDDSSDEEMYRRIDMAFEKTKYPKTEDKIKLVYTKSKKRLADNQSNRDTI